jgi:competence protein ComEA
MHRPKIVVGVVALSWMASFWLSLAAATPSQAGAADKLPEAPGKPTVVGMCTTCHGSDIITDAPRTVAGWVDTVLSMKEFGATGSDEDFKTVTDYLVVNLALLEVNKSSATEIAQVLGVDEMVSAGVVAYRDKQGPFRSADDLKRVPNLDAAKVDAVGARLLFGS